MDLQHNIFTTMYGLNKSYSKLVEVGLGKSDQGLYVPIINLASKERTGISLDVESWKELKTAFDDIYNYFTVHRESSLDNEKKIYNTIGVNFGTCYNEKAVEISEKVLRGSETRPHRASVVFQKNTFVTLLDISRCVDMKLEELTEIAPDINKIQPALVEYLKNILREDKTAVQSLGDADIDKLREKTKEIDIAVVAEWCEMVGGRMDKTKILQFCYELLSLNYNYVKQIILQ